MPNEQTLYPISRGMRVFALTRAGFFIEAMVKDAFEDGTARLLFPRITGRKNEDATLSLSWIAHPDEPVAIVRLLWKEVEGGPCRFRIDRMDYPEFHRPAESWPCDEMLYESAENELFFGPVDTPVSLRPQISLPSKLISLDLPRSPDFNKGGGRAFRKRIQTSFGRF